jgi:tetratricopeptide (TPR) repeat protein
MKRARRSWRLAVAVIGAAAIAVAAAGCAYVRAYQSRVAAEEAFARGAQAAARGDLDQAQREFAAALRAAPDSASVNARVGLVYMAMRPQRPATALPYLRRALELDPRQPAVLYLQAILAAAKLGRDDDARAVLRRAARRFRGDAHALNDIGYLLVDADQLSREALPLLQCAVELEPRNGMIIDSLGWAYYRLGELARAERLLARATRLAPGNAELENHRGVVYAARGKSNEARRQFARALRLNPRFAPALRALRKLRDVPRQ